MLSRFPQPILLRGSTTCGSASTTTAATVCGWSWLRRRREKDWAAALRSLAAREQLRIHPVVVFVTVVRVGLVRMRVGQILMGVFVGVSVTRAITIGMSVFVMVVVV